MKTQIKICDESGCTDPDHYSPEDSDEANLILIREWCSPKGDCRIWQYPDDAVDPAIETVSHGATVTLDVRRFVYEQEHGVKLPAETPVTMTCRNKKCVSYKHVMAGRVTRKDTRNRTVTDEAAEMRERARLFMIDRNAEMVKEYS